VAFSIGGQFVFYYEVVYDCIMSSSKSTRNSLSIRKLDDS